CCLCGVFPGDSSMPQSVRSLRPVLAGLLFTVLSPASAAEREDVRKVINLVTSVKMPFPEHLTRNRAKTERVWLEREGTTTGCIRLEDRRGGVWDKTPTGHPAGRPRHTQKTSPPNHYCAV